MLVTRKARRDDLDDLLILYRHLNPNMPKLSEQRTKDIWREALANENLSLMVSVIEDRPVATCLLITAPPDARRRTAWFYRECRDVP